MAAAPCRSACAAAPREAARHQAVKSSALIRTQQVSPHSVAGKVRGVTLPTSNIYSQNSLLLNLRPCRGSCRQRGSRLIVRAAADYYSVLGVSKEASKTDIRSAYRKIVKSYHPDVNKEPGAEQVIKGELPQLQGKASLCMAYGWCQQIHTILSTKHQFFSPNIWLASRLELKS